MIGNSPKQNSKKGLIDPPTHRPLSPLWGVIPHLKLQIFVNFVFFIGINLFDLQTKSFKTHLYYVDWNI